MTIPEAVRLVIQAAADPDAREKRWCSTWVNRCGSQDCPAADGARGTLGADSLHRPSEKCEKLQHQQLFGDDEEDIRPVHPAVSHVTVPGLDPAWLRGTVGPNTAAETINELVRAPDTALTLDRIPYTRSALEDRHLVTLHVTRPVTENNGASGEQH